MLYGLYSLAIISLGKEVRAGWLVGWLKVKLVACILLVYLYASVSPPVTVCHGLVCGLLSCDCCN